MKQSARRMRSALKRMLTGKRLVVIASLFVLTLAPISRPNYSSVYASPDSVTISVEQADSLIQKIDDQALRIQLLRIDLRETRQIAAVDSVMHAEQLRLYREERPNWIERFLKKPELWFMLGVMAGLYSHQDL